ncbi:MAG: NAD(P)/FAD-dependent oxidoreductase [Acidobacteria bacterium]|nr:NAD(P)/FAD-dependent oxidoreductase [Acidobacteriota bacterium]MCA1633720.1 NAD(P)/FAD-dependent oxidoreductase [Acidobacteriota bacterium]
MNKKAERLADRNFDVIVVGGGPAGASASIQLASAGASVLLVEQKKFPREKLCGEFISPECLAHFARLGVAESMAVAGGTALRETIFYATGGRRVAVPSEWLGGAGRGAQSCALGLSRAEMDARLLARAREAGATVLEEAHASGIVSGDGRVSGVRVQARGGEERVFGAGVTLDATGRARSLARRVGRGARDGDDDGEGDAASNQKRRRLVAFKAHLEGARVAEGACEIYFYRGGYGGLSGVERGLSNLCFIVAARDVRALGSDAGRVLREVVMSNRRAAETLRGARVSSAWLAVALESFGRFRVAPAPGLLAAGDAASFIDPFTGSGMLMALESGELAATVLARHLAGVRARSSNGASNGSLDALAGEYRALYRERFGRRLRVCSYLRRAAFAPQPLVGLGVAALGASAGLRCALARATRG